MAGGQRSKSAARAGPLAPRLRRLPLVAVLGREVPIAFGLRARLLGLARLDRAKAGAGLLIPRCSSVHTFGMRFALDLVFLDRAGQPVAVRRDVPPRRVVSVRAAAAVLELPALSGDLLPPQPSEGGEIEPLVTQGEADAAPTTRDRQRRRL